MPTDAVPKSNASSAPERPEKKALTMKAASLCLTMLKPSAPACDRILPAGLQHETNRRLRQAVQDGGADGHEAECDPVIRAGIDRDDIGDGQADLAAR